MGIQRLAVRAVAVLAVAASTVTLTTPISARQIAQVRVGQWSGGAYSDDRTGQFTHCAASVPYRSSIAMVVSINRSWSWGLGFLDLSSTWALTAGAQIPIEVRFDGRAPWNGNARAINASFALLPMADDSYLVQEFRRSMTMEVVAKGQTTRFSLTDTSALLPILANCVREQLAIERGEQPRVAAAPRPQPTPPRQLTQPANTPPAPTAPAAPSATDLQLQATQIATNLLLNARLENARLVPTSETPALVRERGVMWTSDQGPGTVQLVGPGLASTTQEVASVILAEDARACRGEFASGRSSALVDETVVTRAFSACQDSNRSARFAYVIVARPAGGFVVFGFMPRATAASERSEDPAPQATVEQAALRAVAR